MSNCIINAVRIRYVVNGVALQFWLDLGNAEQVGGKLLTDVIYLYIIVIQTFMVYSIRFSPEEQMLIEQYASVRGTTISDVIRKATMEMIEDELDIEICRKALKNYEKDPKTYSHDDIKRELGLL